MLVLRTMLYIKQKSTRNFYIRRGKVAYDFERHGKKSMKKRIRTIIAAGMAGIMFGVLYPEYILLPDTYQYIEEVNVQDGIKSEKESKEKKDLNKLLYADPENIVISSRFFQFLVDEGIVLWKNLNWDIMDMP